MYVLDRNKLPLSELLDLQQGVVTRAQAISAGLSRHAIAARVETGRWQRLHRGVFATFSGPACLGTVTWMDADGASESPQSSAAV